MIGTLFSILIAIYIWYHPLSSEPIQNTGYFAAVVFIISALFVSIQTAITLFAWGPLQKNEQNLTPRIVKTFKNDRNLKATNLFLLFFLFFTYILIIDALVIDLFSDQSLVVIWTLFLGISVDFLNHHLKRVMLFLDPFQVIELFSGHAQECVRGSKEAELCDWIDAISETSVKALTKNSTSLSIHAIEHLRDIAKNYLEVAKGITYKEQDAIKFGGSDHVSYILFYLFQRMEMIFEEALKVRQEPVCSKVITILGKICIDGAKYDITVAGYPLHFLGKFALKAQQEGLQETGNRATLTLLELSKTIIKDVDLQYVEIKEFFLSILTNMHEIAKNIFRSDKTINVQILTQPFYQFKELFQTEKMAKHQDTDVIIRNITMVIEEFGALEQVLLMMPRPPQAQTPPPEEKPPEKAPEQ